MIVRIFFNKKGCAKMMIWGCIIVQCVISVAKIYYLKPLCCFLVWILSLCCVVSFAMLTSNRILTFLFTSDSVNEGYLDKLCDWISDVVLDACLTQDPTTVLRSPPIEDTISMHCSKLKNSWILCLNLRN